MGPRILVIGMAVMVLGFLYRALVGAPSFEVWAVIITVVVSLGLARVCSTLLSVTAALEIGFSDLNSEVARHASVAVASPQLVRFYFVRLVVYLALGTALGVLNVTLDVLTPSADAQLSSFLVGPMVGVIYGYFATGWDLAKRAATLRGASSLR